MCEQQYTLSIHKIFDNQIPCYLSAQIRANFYLLDASDIYRKKRVTSTG